MDSRATTILQALGKGESADTTALLSLLYDELRQLAAARLEKEPPGQTIQATALVHEVYLRLIGNEQESESTWENRAHFFGAAAEAMRRVLIDNARRKRAAKRGGDGKRVDMEDLDELQLAVDVPSEDLLALNVALEKLEQADEQKAQLVKLRYFAGLTLEEAAKTMGIGRSTAARLWRFSRAWLLKELQDSDVSD